MKRIAFLISLILITSSLFAGFRIKEKVDEKFVVHGSVVVEFQPNAGDYYSVEKYRQENRRKVFFSKTIKDELFACENHQPGDKKRIYLVGMQENHLFTTEEARSFIAKMNGQCPTLPWVLLLQEQYGAIWSQKTAIFTDVRVQHDDLNLVPYISPSGNVNLGSEEYPWEDFDFIFMVDEPSETATSSN